MPYGLIFPAAVAWLTYRYCGMSAPSMRSKCIVGVSAAASLTVGSYVSIYLVLLLQLGIACYILLYMKVTQGD